MRKISNNKKNIELNALLNYAIEKFQLESEDMIEIIKNREKELCIPISVFSEKTGMLESASLYLHDKKNLSFKQIALLLKRDYKTIWASYNKGKRKLNKSG